MKRLIFILLSFICVNLYTVAEDRIILNDDSELVGKIVQKDADGSIYFSTKDGSIKMIRPQQIKSIVSENLSLWGE